MYALTIGKFESIHRGHQQLIKKTVMVARQRNLTSVVVTFNPHPRCVLNNQATAYHPLFTYEEREQIIKGFQIDRVASYVFDNEFLSQSPEAFALRLIKEHDVKVLVLGEGYRFGKDRAGTVDTIQRIAESHGIQVCVLPHIKPEKFQERPDGDESKKISTSDIRAFLSKGMLSEASALLGFYFFIIGKVTQGKQVGKKLGFPTVNIIPPTEKFLPPHGVYATRVRVGQQIFNSVTNIGIRPSFDDGSHRTVETFLLDFDKALYHETIRVDFLRYLRAEKKFENLEALQSQITKDVAEAWL